MTLMMQQKQHHVGLFAATEFLAVYKNCKLEITTLLELTCSLIHSFPALVKMNIINWFRRSNDGHTLQ